MFGVGYDHAVGQHKQMVLIGNLYIDCTYIADILHGYLYKPKQCVRVEYGQAGISIAYRNLYKHTCILYILQYTVLFSGHKLYFGICACEHEFIHRLYTIIKHIGYPCRCSMSLQVST